MRRTRTAGYRYLDRRRACIRHVGTASHRLSAMAATDPIDEISELSSKLATVEAVLDPDALREMQPCRDRCPGSRDDANRPSERGKRDRPHPGLEAVERDAGIHQPEEQEHALHGKAPPALEKR